MKWRCFTNRQPEKLDSVRCPIIVAQAQTPLLSFVLQIHNRGFHLPIIPNAGPAVGPASTLPSTLRC